MVHNPIYDHGDTTLYESVHNEQCESRDTVTQYDNIRCTAPSCKPEDNSIPDANCCVDHKYTPCVTAKSTRKISLEKNGQERNKLHLTLSLRGNDSSPTKGMIKSFPIPSEVVDESYMKMCPAGAAVRLTLNSKFSGDSPLFKDAIKHDEC